MRIKFLVDKVIEGRQYYWGMQYEYELFDEKLLDEFEKANEIRIIGRKEPQIEVIEVIEEKEEIKEEVKQEIKEVKRKRKTKKE